MNKLNKMGIALVATILVGLASIGVAYALKPAKYVTAAQGCAVEALQSAVPTEALDQCAAKN